MKLHGSSVYAVKAGGVSSALEGRGEVEVRSAAIPAAARFLWKDLRPIIGREDEEADSDDDG